MNPVVRHERVGPSDARQRLRIAHLSDLHLWFSDRKLGAIERVLATWQPDVVALTGDYADTPVGQRLVVGWMQRMSTMYPLCWIAGNHDRWWGQTFCATLETLCQVHSIDHSDAQIAARDGSRYRFTTLTRMLNLTSAELAEPTIVLIHDPAPLESEKFCETPNLLFLAGHLHGGQITLWRDRHGRPQPAASCYKWLVDRATIGTSTLIVSRGLGETLPLRIQAPREIVMVDFWT
jgi:uncharacterized protein